MLRSIHLLALPAILLGCGENGNHLEQGATPPLITAAETGDLATLKQLLQQTLDSCR